MTLARKLQIRPGQAVHVVNAPDGFSMELPADAVLLFARNSAEFDAAGRPFLDAARRDALAYVAYPKAGQLDTDLNRDILARRIVKEGLRGVRQVSVDEVWSAMRFRPR